jgi:hypothetical protein
MRRLQVEINTTAPTERICRGTLISRAQYLIDIQKWGYQDARQTPGGSMTPEEIEAWTDAIGTIP